MRRRWTEEAGDGAAPDHPAPVLKLTRAGAPASTTAMAGRRKRSAPA